VTGEDLKSFLRRAKRLDIGTAISIAKQVCEGLIEAHKTGIVHRDLKPSNIMIDKAGNARIMDFGIARSIKGEAITGENVIIGTPDYMSPEQVEGKDIDQRSDIYSLGVVLFEMLTGERPFKGDSSLSVAMKHKSEAPPNPKWLNDQTPDSLSRLVLKCLEKDKERRYQSAEELLSALGSLDEKKLRIAEKEEKKKSIAVLPFTNMSADPEQEYFCDGMAEEIINSLTHIKDLKVIARTSAFAFKGKHEDIREIGRKLDVESLLEGSVRKAGNRLRIMAQLINVADGSHLWSERYDREMKDIFDIQDEISLAIVDNLKVKLLGEEKEGLVKHRTENQEAYHLYLKGRYFADKLTVKGLEEAIECFQQALKLDPDYAPAHSGLAWTYVISSYYGNVPLHQTFPKAKESALRALELDDSLGEVHAYLGIIYRNYEWDRKKAELEFQKALQLNPTSSDVHHHYSVFLAIAGRQEEAIIEAKLAQELDPLSSFINAHVGVFYYFAGKFDDAIEELQKALRMDPNFFVSHGWLGWAYGGKLEFEKAISELEKAVELSEKNPQMIAHLAVTNYEFGNKDRANELISSLKERSKDEYVHPSLFYMIYLVLGDQGKALEWLEQALKGRDHFLLFTKCWPVDNFRIPDEPEFQALLKKYGLG
jgi:serine/threonine-protein kinase